MVLVACLCPLTLQAQEVKSLKTEMSKTDVKTVSLDTIPNVSLPREEYIPSSRPMLGGFPVLQGNSYYSEAQEPWMSEDGKPLAISPNAISRYETPKMNLGQMSAYSSGEEVPGLMNKQSAGFVYQQNIGRFVFSPYLGLEKINTGVYGFGNLTKATFGGTMSYQVNDWLKVGLYGQFVPTKTHDPRSIIMSPFLPKNAYGGFMEVMFNQHWGVGAKMGREFAPQKNGKWGWKNTTEIYPIFKK